MSDYNYGSPYPAYNMNPNPGYPWMGANPTPQQMRTQPPFMNQMPQTQMVPQMNRIPMNGPAMPNSIFGRVIKADEQVTAFEVPGDGNAGYYPAEDGSCILVKRWTGDGNISTLKYVPAGDISNDSQNSDTVTLNDVMNRLDYICGKFETPEPRHSRPMEVTDNA